MIIIIILFINLYKLVIYHLKVAKKIKHHYNLEYFVGVTHETEEELEIEV